MTTIGLSYSLVKRSTKCAPALATGWAIDELTGQVSQKQTLPLGRCNFLPTGAQLFASGTSVQCIAAIKNNGLQYGFILTVNTPTLSSNGKQMSYTCNKNGAYSGACGYFLFLNQSIEEETPIIDDVLYDSLAAEMPPVSE